MYSFILRRFIGGLVVVFFVITSTFFMLRLLPGGPFDKEKKLPEEIKLNIEKKYHLDKPLFQQYLLYLSGIIRADFGPSYKFLHRTATDIIRDVFPVSLRIGFISFIVSLFLGILIGFSSAGSKIFESFFSLVISLPSFVFASVMIIILSLRLGIFPPALIEGWKHYILPVLTLSLGPMIYIAKLTKTSVEKTLKEQFIVFAKSKGVYGYNFFKHVLYPSLSSVFSISGMIFTFLITGSFIVETIFAIPGMGRYFVLSVIDRDYPVVMALTVVFTVVLVIMNVFSEIIYSLFDPRARER